MEGDVEASCKKTLELQNILSQCVWIKEISQKKVESKEVKGKWRRILRKIGENQLGFFGNKKLSAPIKGDISYPAGQHILKKQASPRTAGTFNFKPCSPIFFFSLLTNHPEHDQAIVELQENLLKPPILLSPSLPLILHQIFPNFPLLLL
ncbi:unnamed protein product [Prunus armeniaca]